MIPQEIEAKVERLNADMALLRQELSTSKGDLGNWVLSVGGGHLLFSLALWIGMLLSHVRDNTELLLIFAVPATLSLFTAMCVLFANFAAILKWQTLLRRPLPIEAKAPL